MQTSSHNAYGIVRRLAFGQRTRFHRRRMKRWLCHEQLEDRCVLSSTLFVTTPQDLINPSDGHTSLREAISTATSGDEIRFDGSLAGQTINLGSQITINKNLTITGLGASELAISGQDQSRVFKVDFGRSVSISALTIKHGKTDGSDGGGILNEGQLNVQDCVFTENNSLNAAGGAIHNDGQLTVGFSLFSDNVSSNAGGAIFNHNYQYPGNPPTLTIESSTFDGNVAVVGGAVWSYSPASATISNSTFTANQAASTGPHPEFAKGGAIYNYGPMTIKNSTFVGNSTTGYAGGISNGYMDYWPGYFDGINAPFAITMSNTIVAGNLAEAPAPYNVADYLGPVSSQGYNLLGINSSGYQGGYYSWGWNAQDLVGIATSIDPMIGPLQYYGGPTPTMALLPGSPAIDAGNPSVTGFPAYDQRGVGYPRVVGGRVDIGAYESQGFTVSVFSGDAQSTTVDTAFANPLVVTVTANNASEPVAGGKVTFMAPASGASATLLGTPATIGADGHASVTATANALPGDYSVSASAVGAADSVGFNLTNTVPNLLPVAEADGAYAVGEDGGVPLDGSASYDPDGSIVGYAWDFDYDGVTFDVDATGVAPTFSAAGLDGPLTRTVALRVTDNLGETAMDTATVNVLNLPPLAVNDAPTVLEDSGPVIVDVLSNDSDPAGTLDPLVVDSATDGAHGTVVVNGGLTVSYQPVLDFHGVDKFTYTISDGDGGYATATVMVTVNPVNDPPKNSVPGAQPTSEDTSLVISGVSVADVDDDPLVTTLSVPAGSGTLTVVVDGATIENNGTALVTISGSIGQVNTALASITYVPTADYNTVSPATPISLTVFTSDGTANGTDTVLISVAPVADIVPDAVTTPEDKPITFNALTGAGGGSADNFENPGRTVTSVTQGAHGTVLFAADGTLAYAPNLNYSGADSFTYTVTSGGVMETATVSVTVLSVQQQLVVLKAEVQELINNGSLPPGEGNSLIVKLDSADAAFAKSNTTAGINKLEAFIKEVNAKVKARKLTPAEGQALIDAANAAIESVQTNSASARRLAFAELGNGRTWLNLDLLSRL